MASEFDSDGKPEQVESPQQYIVRLTNNLNRWIELSKTDKNYDASCLLVVKEQFIQSCMKDLAIHLRERAPKDLDELAKIADPFLDRAQKKYV